MNLRHSKLKYLSTNPTFGRHEAKEDLRCYQHLGRCEDNDCASLSSTACAGQAQSEFVADMSQAGYRFSESQLDRWVARVNAGEAAVSTTKAWVPPVHLAREQRDIAGGWLLSQNLRGVSVHRLD